MVKPTLVLVHGAWHAPAHFEPLVKQLEVHEYKCIPVSLPSVHFAEGKVPTGLSEDIDMIRSTVITELASNNVVVVCHSYGGLPTMSALTDLDAASREKTGKSTSVLGIAAMCSILLPPGGSMLETAFGGKPLPIHDVRGDLVYVGQPGPEHYFYNDLAADEAAKWSALLKPQAWAANIDTAQDAAFMYIPTSYLFCTEDQALVYEAQKAIVGGCEAAGAKIRTEEFESSHSPFLSLPERAADFIRRSAGENIPVGAA